MQVVWDGRIVSESTLTSHVNAVRKVIGDTGKQQRLIRTVARKGLRFVGPVREELQSGRSAVATPDVSTEETGGIPALPDAPSIAVLPFRNLSGDAEQDYFADGVVEDIITALSRIRWLFVIARNSSFTYKGKAVDIRQVGRELGVRYVLEGSVRKAGNKVRITGQLIEAVSARHVWAEKFDGDLADIFDLQDRITESIVGAIEPSLLSAEIARAEHKPTANLDAYDLYLRAWALYGSMNRSTIRNAIELLVAAIALDPTYAQAKALAAICHGDLVQQRWDDPGDFSASDRLAKEALAVARDDPIALAFASQIVAYISKDYETALAAADQALAICPNSCGFVTLWMGEAVCGASG